MEIIERIGDWFILNEGKRRSDRASYVNWTKGRLLVIADADHVYVGHKLESIPFGPRFKRTCAIMCAKDWEGAYVVAWRDDWTPDDYFMLIARLFGERGISTP